MKWRKMNAQKDQGKMKKPPKMLLHKKSLHPLWAALQNLNDDSFQQVKLAYMDDRKSKLIRDEIEKQQRTARAAAAASHASTPRPASSSPTREMPGSGHVLSPLVAEVEDTSSHEVHPHVE